MAVRIRVAASHRLDAIHRDRRDRWGAAQAERYLAGPFAPFLRIESPDVASKPVPAEFGVECVASRSERHVVCWRRLANDDIGIATIQHARTHLIDRFRDDAAD